MITKVVKISPNNLENNINDIKTAAEIICRGGLVAFPTETVYGLGGDATNPDATKKIYRAKGRPSDNPLIIHICDPKDAEKYVYTTPLFYKLAERFMPGPLTVILLSRESIPPETRGGLNTVAVRIPSNNIARELIRCAGVPIAAPSANLSGKPSPTCASHVIEDMQGRVDVIIDGGDCDFGLESTIVKIEDNESLTLLRPGKITAEELSLICDISVADAVVESLKEGEIALSPGMKYRHYAPQAPVILLDGELQSIIDYIKENLESNFAIICYSEDVFAFSELLGSENVYDLGPKSNPEIQAHKLFSVLRETDKKNYNRIYAPLPECNGVSLALYNRMIRAAAHTVIKL